MKSILTEKGESKCLSLNKAFENIQRKVSQTLGPLSQIWEFMDGKEMLQRTYRAI